MVKRNITPEDLTMKQLCRLASDVTKDNFDLRWELQNLKEKHRWIPVEERLPEHNGVGVFVCDANYEGIGECWCCSYDSGKFRRDGADMTDRITHWKPLILP